MREAELSGISIVGAGSFNPAILHPTWLLAKDLIPQNLAESATDPDSGQPCVVTPQVTSFVADWLTLQVTQEQAAFSTIERSREGDLRDLVRGVFELLPETPIDAIGINSDTHFKLETDDAWHAFGDRFLPKDFWEPMFAGDSWGNRGDGGVVGMRAMTVEVQRAQDGFPGYIRVQLAPSVRVAPRGVYAGINAHFQLTADQTDRSNAEAASSILLAQWEETRRVENELIERLLEAV